MLVFSQSRCITSRKVSMLDSLNIGSDLILFRDHCVVVHYGLVPGSWAALLMLCLCCLAA